MLGFITWNVDPILIHIGDGGIRWYGLLWAIGIYLAYLIQIKLYKNENCPADWTDKLFMWMVIGIPITSVELAHGYARNPNAGWAIWKLWGAKRFLSNTIGIILKNK